MTPPQISAVARSIDPVRLSGGPGGGGKGKRYEIQKRWIEDPGHANIEYVPPPLFIIDDEDDDADDYGGDG